MFESVNEVAVLVTTILASAVGSIWYSPLLFGETWMRAIGLTDADMEASKVKMPKMFVLSFIGNLMLLFMIAQFAAFATMAGLSVWYMSLCIVVLIGAVMSAAVIWEQKSGAYFLINVGYMAVVVFGGMAVISYWPW